MKNKKIIIIDTCFDCPHMQVFGKEYQCNEIGRMLKSPRGYIPNDCPLENFVEDE